MKKTRKCEYCGKEFTPKNSVQKYCSSRCKAKVANKKRRVPWNNKGICVNCGREFKKIESNQKYCSKACALDAYNKQRRKGSIFSTQFTSSAYDAKQQILKWLKVKSLSRGELSRRLDKSKETIVKLTDELAKEGYDLTYDEATKHYTLQTGLQSSFEAIALKPIFKNTLKFGQVSDTHFGSKYQQPTLLKTAYQKFEEEEVAFVLHSGDVVEGKGLYRGQEQECFLLDADEQKDYVVKTYPKTNAFKTYLIAGSHDTSYKKLAGYNIVRSICHDREDLVYCGDTASTFEIRGLKFQMLHPSGGVPYARSYRPQKIIEGMVGDVTSRIRELTQIQRTLPHYLALGHYHVGLFLPNYMGVCGVVSFCLQAQTPYLSAKGLYPDIGFEIIEVTFDDNGNFLRIIPHFYRLNSFIKEKDY